MLLVHLLPALPLAATRLQIPAGQGFCDSKCVSDLNDLLVMKGQEWGEIYVIPSQIPEFCLCKEF